MKRILILLSLIICVVSLSAFTFSVELYDTYGDGWNGGSLDILVNGSAVLTGLTVASGNGPESHNFDVVNGDEITTTYTAGSWSSENEYTIYDHLGANIAESGIGGSTPASITTPIVVNYNANTPGEITDAVPADGAGAIATNASVTWNWGALTETYDLYFDTVNPPVTQVVTDGVAGAEGTQGSYTPGRLTTNTTYYWQVVSKNTLTRLEWANPVYSYTTELGANIVEIGFEALTNQALPIEPYYGYSYTQSIYYQADIDRTGERIEKIWYHYNGATDLSASTDWVIYMGHTANTEFATTSDWIPLANLTQVCSVTLDPFPDSDGWIEFVLDMPFVYNNVDNLVIAVEENLGGYDSSSDEFFCSATATAQSLAYRSDSTNPDPATPPAANYLQSSIPNIRMEFAAVPTVPVFSIDNESWDYGLTLLGDTATQTFTITNMGGADLVISTPIAMQTGTDFTVVDANTYPLTLGVGVNASFDVEFSPTVGGALNDVIVIVDNTTRTTQNIPVTGEGDTSTPDPVTIVAPADAAVDQPSGGTLEWNASALADGYDLYFGTDNPPTDMVNGTDLGDVLTYTYSGLASGTTYYWQVVPYNFNGDATGAAVWSFTTTANPPSPVALIAPADAAIDQPLYLELSWATDALAGGYKISVGTDNPPTDVVRDYDNGVATTYDVMALAGGTTYYWQVIPYNAAGDAENCPVWSFTTYTTQTNTTFPYTQSFDTDTLPTGWLIDPVVSGDSWEIGNSELGGHGATAEHTGNSGYMMVIDDSSPETVPAHLYSELMDLTGLTAPMLGLYYWIGDSSNTSELHIDIYSGSTMNQSVAVLTNPAGAATDGWMYAEVDLAAYIGQTIQIDFRAMESTSFYGDISIDDINIFDDIAPPAAATAVAPVDGALDQLPDGNLEWTAAFNADGYDLYFGIDNPPTTIVNGDDQGTALTYAYSGLDPLTMYYWQVVPYNQNGSTANCPVWSFTTVGTNPGTASVVNPLDGAVDQDFGVTLEWTAATIADGYYVNFGTDNPPTNILNMYDNGVDLTTDVSGLAGGTTYYWEVIPYNANGNASGYATWSFTTYASTPGEIAMTTPADLATGVSEYTTFQWISDVWADGYNLYVSDDNVNFTMTDVGNVTGVTLTSPLGYETMYYWYVTGYNINGEGNPPAANYSFTTQSNPNYGGDGTLYGGYYFANSTVDGNGLGYQPTFDWVDISATGSTPTYTSADDGYMEVPIGFTFNYFGNDYDMIYIGTNGYCMFTSPTGSTAGGMSIPNAGSPNDVIALAGMDLHTANVPSVPYYGLDANGNFVYTVEMWNDYGDANEYMDMQLILYPDGRIKIQYQNYFNADTESGTSTIQGDACIGIENIDGTIGIQYRNNGVGGPMLDDMAVAFATTEAGLGEPSTGLDAPTNLVLNYNGVSGLMELSWDAVTGATMYDVYAGTTPDFVVGPASFLSTWPTNMATMDPTMLPGNHYFAKIIATDGVVRDTPVAVNTFSIRTNPLRNITWVEYIEPTPEPEKKK